MRLTTCRACGEPVIFAVISNKAGKPPGRMPLNPKPDPDGNVAAYKDAAGRLVGRVVGKGGPHHGYERLMMPHFATCTERQAGVAAGQLPVSPPAGNVTQLDTWRKALAGRARDRRNQRGT